MGNENSANVYNHESCEKNLLFQGAANHIGEDLEFLVTVRTKACRRLDAVLVDYT